MKSMLRRLAPLALVLACAVPAFAQGRSTPQGSSQPWRDIEKQLGLQTTYSVDMVINAMGLNMESRVYRDGEKSRTEMTMPFMNLKMAMLEIPQGGQTVSYSLFPEKKKYMLNEDAGGEDAAPALSPKVEDLGSEAVDGVTCAKRRVTMVQEGVKSDMTVWLSPKLKDMPVKMAVNATLPAQPGQPAMPMQTTILFKNYDFSAPDASLFAVPAGYTRANDMMEIMMGGSEGLGALMQQMQNMQVEE
jgi:hypothetical protein